MDVVAEGMNIATVMIHMRHGMDSLNMNDNENYACVRIDDDVLESN